MYTHTCVYIYNMYIYIDTHIYIYINIILYTYIYIPSPAPKAGLKGFGTQLNGRMQGCCCQLRRQVLRHQVILSSGCSPQVFCSNNDVCVCVSVNQCLSLPIDKAMILWDSLKRSKSITHKKLNTNATSRW